MERSCLGTAVIDAAVCYYQERVYYSHTDAGGIVYHSNYLDLTEHARTELLRVLGIEQAEALSGERRAFVVRSLSIDYIKPAFLDDLLTVETTVDRCERFSMLLSQVIKRGEEVLSTQKTKVGHVNLETGRPIPIPEDVRTVLLSIHTA